MVGLPYPNPTDPELQERMRFMDRAAGGGAGEGPSAGSAAAGGTAASGTAAAGRGTAAGGDGTAAGGGGTAAGREYYQDLCMKAVNQCIGRVIRHRGDHAAVLLVDARWGGGLVPGGLWSIERQCGACGVGWMQDGLQGLAGWPAACPPDSSTHLPPLCHWPCCCRYAAAVDSRGQFTGPLAKLPGWIQQSLQVSPSFGDAFGRLARFSKAMAAADAAAVAAEAAAAPLG